MRFLFCYILLIVNFFAYSQKLSDVDSILRIKYPTISGDGWHYLPKQTKLIKLNKPELSKLIPNFRYYRAKLINTLSYHIDESECLLVFDNRTKSIDLVEPLWYSGESIKFLKLFEGKTLKDSNTLKQFVIELQSLFKIDKDFLIDNTKYGSGTITFDIHDLNSPNRTRSYRITAVNLTIKEIKYQ